MPSPHQYIDRQTSRVATEHLIADPLVNRLYSSARENAPLLFKAVTSRRMSAILGFLNFDLPVPKRASGNASRIRAMGIDLAECLDRPQDLNTARKLFERKIRYWQCRPMPPGADRIVSPADARVIVGSFDCHDALFLKEKFFSFNELIGEDKSQWINAFAGGAFAVFRLTPDKYHYNHVPVSGRVQEIYTIDGRCHSCNPGAVVSMVTPFSKNRRVVTVIDTDVPGGTGIGRVAMIEIVAMMIGDIVQCYSTHGYDDPLDLSPGMFVEKGCPKSLYRPGSSVDVLIFQRDRVRFCADILANMQRRDVISRYTLHFRSPLVETDVRVRSEIGWKK
ncbi:MAG: phosphatidylserine decarboxylase [Desulfosarcina sp.]|nr:phosphatidylserine decarboxylase [Desulfosarcina sp.]